VIVDELRLRARDGFVERSARVRWSGGEFRLWVATPPELASDDEDASPFACAALLLAMRLGEDLEVGGRVSPLLLDSAPRIVDLYARWDPRLHRSRLRAERGPAGDGRAPGVGCFFSRGVDSMYSASVPRGLPGELTHLVYCDGLEPLHSPPVRAEEMRLAREAASVIGVPLVVVETNLRDLCDPLVRDWADMAGAGLAFLATAMAGALGNIVVPSSAAQATVIPTGTSPMLDPIFSTDAVAIFHDTPADRPDKVAWLARERPGLLPYLKVCFSEDRPDNCGRCQKCLLTMLALEASESLRLATGFPSEIDPEAMLALSVRGIQPELEYRAVEKALRLQGKDGLADLVAGALARGAATPLRDVRDATPDFLARAERDVS
jgi:hypothetical protein